MGKIKIMSNDNLLCQKFAAVCQKIATSCPTYFFNARRHCPEKFVPCMHSLTVDERGNPRELISTNGINGVAQPKQNRKQWRKCVHHVADPPSKDGIGHDVAYFAMKEAKIFPSFQCINQHQICV